MENNTTNSSEIDIIASFNSAIVASRLYPMSAPQVTTSMDRCFKLLNTYLSAHKHLSISINGEQKFVNEEAVEDNTFKEKGISNLVIYRQLELLQVQNLFFPYGLKHADFEQLIAIFVAKQRNIERKGGKKYISDLGIERFFPDSLEEAQARIQNVSTQEDAPQPIDALFGKTLPPALLNELSKTLNNPSAGAEIVSAGIIKTLDNKIAGSIRLPDFAQFLDNVQDYVQDGNKERLAQKSADALLTKLSFSNLCLIIAQEFSSDFSQKIYETLLSILEQSQLEELADFFIAQCSSEKQQSMPESMAKEWQNSCRELFQNPRVIALNKPNIFSESALTPKQENLVTALLAGDDSFLHNNSFFEQLPNIISVLQEKDDSRGQKIIALLSDKFIAMDVIRDKVIACFLIITKDLLEKDNWSWIIPMLKTYASWLTSSSVANKVYEDISRAMYRIMLFARRNNFEEQADKILVLFYKLRIGELAKPSSIRNLIAQVQDSEIDQSLLPSMLNDFLQNPSNDRAARRLLLQGPVVTRYLVNELILSGSREDRLNMLALLARDKKVLPKIILERLNEHMPWYGKRNLIKLLGETGVEENAKEALAYIDHEDPRVQQEAFICLEKLGGNNKKALFLRAIDENSVNEIRSKIIQGLSQYKDSIVAKRLYAELFKYQQINGNEKNPSIVIAQLIRAIAQYPQSASQESIRTFMRVRNSSTGKMIDEQIWELAEKAIAHIENSLDNAKKRTASPSGAVRKSMREVRRISAQEKKIGRITGDPLERQMYDLLDSGDPDDINQGARIFRQLIEKLARAHQFEQASRLRKWLMNAPAYGDLLGDCLWAGDVIDQEKAASIDAGYLEVWRDLHDTLNTDEFNSFYHSLIQQSFTNDENIVEQGSYDKLLIFVNSGKVKLSYKHMDSEMLVTTMGRGNVLGANIFFDSSVWTISVSSMGAAQVSILDFEHAEMLMEDFPEIEIKLRDFCYNMDKISTFFGSRGKDRRESKRLPISGRFDGDLLSSEQHETTDIRGDLTDISTGGISFSSHITNRDNARMLLGRKIRVFLPGEGRKASTPQPHIGEILAVQMLPNQSNEYSIHIRFDDNIASNHLRKIVAELRKSDQRHLER